MRNAKSITTTNYLIQKGYKNNRSQGKPESGYTLFHRERNRNHYTPLELFVSVTTLSGLQGMKGKEVSSMALAAAAANVNISVLYFTCFNIV